MVVRSTSTLILCTGLTATCLRLLQIDSPRVKIYLNMTFWPNLFGKSNDKFQTLEDKLTFHEQNSEQNLHTTHPNLKGIFDKQNINLRNIRRHTPKIAAAAAVLGAFLAIPYLIGHPTQTTPREQTAQTGQPAKPVPGRESGSPPTLGGGTEAAGVQVNQPNDAPVSQTPTPPPAQDDQSKSHGHTYGRSYLAPPKEHGLHDLGLHKGAHIGKGRAQAPGPHPQDVEVRHPEKGENS